MRAPTSTNRLPSRCDGTSGAIGCMSPEDSVWSSRFRTVSVVTASWCRRSQVATYSSWSRKEADHPRGHEVARGHPAVSGRLLAALPLPRWPLRLPLSSSLHHRRRGGFRWPEAWRVRSWPIGRPGLSRRCLGLLSLLPLLVLVRRGIVRAGPVAILLILPFGKEQIPAFRPPAPPHQTGNVPLP